MCVCVCAGHHGEIIFHPFVTHDRCLIWAERRMYTSSSFYSPSHPSMEEQVELARQISHSLSADTNSTSKGQSMYVKRRNRSSKWIHEGIFPAYNPHVTPSTPSLCRLHPLFFVFLWGLTMSNPLVVVSLAGCCCCTFKYIGRAWKEEDISKWHSGQKNKKTRTVCWRVELDIGEEEMPGRHTPWRDSFGRERES